jgi:hypothetical protein
MLDKVGFRAVLMQLRTESPKFSLYDAVRCGSGQYIQLVHIVVYARDLPTVWAAHTTTARCPLSTTHCPLPTAHYPLPIATANVDGCPFLQGGVEGK